MKSDPLRDLSVQLDTPVIMRYTRILAIAQLLCMILFATWLLNL